MHKGIKHVCQRISKEYNEFLLKLFHSVKTVFPVDPTMRYLIQIINSLHCANGPDDSDDDDERDKCAVHQRHVD